MTIGNQASVGSLNSTLSQLALQIRNDMRSVANFFEFLVNSGGTAYLESLDFDSTDATNFYNAANYMNTIAAVYFGTATQSSEFDFDNELSQLWGGQ
jgi:hypothetical protein